MNGNKFKPLKNIGVEKCRKQVPPFESRKHMKTLKDICLDICAKNFEEVFIEKTEGGEKLSVKRDITLPPLLFEDIHDKSRKLGSFIRPRLLKVCLGSRDALNWQNIDLCNLNQGSDRLFMEDLKNIAKDETPVKELSICFKGEFTEESTIFISKFASTLEHLSIETHKGKIKAKRLKETKIKMPNLKYLEIYFSDMSAMLMLDIDSFKGSMRVLRLHHSEGSFHTNWLIKIIKSCKYLISLSLLWGLYEMEEANQIFDAISSLKELRSLDLTGFRNKYGSEKFNLDFIARLPKLENLEISFSNFCWQDRSSLHKIHLKYFGAFDVYNEFSLQIRADVTAREECMDDFLNYIEYAVQKNQDVDWLFLMDIIDSLWPTFIEAVTDNEWYRIELCLMSIIYRDPYKFIKKLMDFIQRPDIYPNWTGDFLAMITRYQMIYFQIEEMKHMRSN